MIPTNLLLMITNLGIGGFRNVERSFGVELGVNVISLEVASRLEVIPSLTTTTTLGSNRFGNQLAVHVSTTFSAACPGLRV